MNKILTDLLIFLMSVVVHEAGHYIAFYMNGIHNPRLKLHWWGVSIGTEEQIENLTLREYIDVNLAGVVLGYAVIMLWVFLQGANQYLAFIYLGACLIDFHNIVNTQSVLREHPELRHVPIRAANVRLAEITIKKENERKV